LAGVLDGEGSVEKKGRLKFTQQQNACKTTAERILGDMGIPFCQHENGAHQRGHEPCYSVVLNPGRVNSGVEHLRLLMQIAPPRILLEFGRRLWEGRSVQIAGEVEVIGLRLVGDREVAAFTTSTETFIANGMLTHNTRGDHKKRSRNSQLGQHYDTLLLGHFHGLIPMRKLIVNGSLVGYNEYAFSNNFTFEQPLQHLWITHPEHGITISMPVLVERSKTKVQAGPWVSWAVR